MWLVIFLLGYAALPDDVGGQQSQQEVATAASAAVSPSPIVVNLTLQSEDGSYVDWRQVG